MELSKISLQYTYFDLKFIAMVRHQVNVTGIGDPEKKENNWMFKNLVLGIVLEEKQERCKIIFDPFQFRLYLNFLTP